MEQQLPHQTVESCCSGHLACLSLQPREANPYRPHQPQHMGGPQRFTPLTQFDHGLATPMHRRCVAVMHRSGYRSIGQLTLFLHCWQLAAPPTIADNSPPDSERRECASPCVSPKTQTTSNIVATTTFSLLILESHLLYKRELALYAVTSQREMSWDGVGKRFALPIVYHRRIPPPLSGLSPAAT